MELVFVLFNKKIGFHFFFISFFLFLAVQLKIIIMKNLKSINAFAKESEKLERKSMENINGGAIGTSVLVRDSDTMINGGADCRQTWNDDYGNGDKIIIV